jgi:hypothetical protein
MNRRARAGAGCLAGIVAIVLSVGGQASPPDRIVSLEVYGEAPCPRTPEVSDSVIVVCGRQPEPERYRIPPRLRRGQVVPMEEAWGSRVQGLDAASRNGRPDSCSPVGSGGQTGCYRRSWDQWRAERRLLDGAKQ